MSEQAKDIALDSNEGIQTQIAQATKALREQLQAKEAEAVELRKVAGDRETAARHAEAQLAQSAGDTTRSNYIAVSAALREHDAQIEMLRTALVQAVETADGKAAADLNIKIADVVNARRTLQNGKEQLEEEIQAERARVERAARNPPKPQQPADPYEAAIAQLHPAQQQWLRQHKDKGYVRPGPEPFSHDLMIAHHAALKAGLAETSPQYFAAMDRVLKHTPPPDAASTQLRAPEAEQDASERFAEAPAAKPQQQAQQRKVVPSAPVSRAAGGGSAAGKSFRLTADQASTASRLGMTPQEYRQFQEVAVARGKLPASVLNG